MIKFTNWIEEKKKTKESSPPTVTSSPLRGANQDQSGYNPKGNVADYTISDEKIPVAELSTELIGKINTARTFGSKKSKTPEAAKTLSTAVKKAWLKSNVGKIKEETINEIISGQPMTGPVQPKVSQGAGMPKSHSALQKAADIRVKAKEKADQKQDEFRAKTALKIIKQRKQDQAKRKSAMEEYIDEGRGRPRKVKTEEDPGSEHVIMQLRKVITTRGHHKVQHVSGEKSHVEPAQAHKMLAHHDNLRTSSEKHEYANRLHKSASSMKDAMSGKAEVKKPKISLAGKITGTQKD